MATCQVCRQPVDGDVCGVCGASAARAGALVPTSGAPIPEVAAPAVRSVPRAQGGEVMGTVVQSEGPIQTEARWNIWKAGCTLLVVAGLLPVVLAVALILVALKVAFWLISGARGGDRSLFDELLAHHMLGRALRRSDPVPVYHHVLETEEGTVSARQEGEFRDGRIFTGNRVTLYGRRARGVLLIDGGFNHTLGTALTPPGVRWKPIFFVLLALVAAEYALLLHWANRSAAP